MIIMQRFSGFDMLVMGGVTCKFYYEDYISKYYD